MKKLYSLTLMALLVLSIMPVISANSIGSGLGINVETEDFPPLVWMCGDRIVSDDSTEPGRFSLGGTPLLERINNYAFEGENIQWTVLVMDKNGANKVQDVFATIGDSQGEGNDIEVNCVEDLGYSSFVDEDCNARILEEDLSGDAIDTATQRYYTCTLTVETADSMYGEYWTTVEAIDLDGLSGTMDENEYWFLNPVIALNVDGELAFENVRPGTMSYSDTILLGNDADAGSGVMLDMFISGTDFYDSSSSGAMCPTSNVLDLEQFAYFATSGAYSTKDDAEVDSAGTVVRDCDAKGYCNIEYGLGFNNPTPFYDDTEIIQAQPVGPYWTANVLAPGAEMAITFRLNLPEPCNGDFDSGQIYFWGEAI